eukprot:2187199-Rhodomonas_salina.1
MCNLKHPAVDAQSETSCARTPTRIDSQHRAPPPLPSSTFAQRSTARAGLVRQGSLPFQVASGGIPVRFRDVPK